MIYYESKYGILYKGDCLEIIPSIQKKIDLVVTSPPYDDLREYKGYAFNFRAIADVLMTSIKDSGVLVWVVGDATHKGSETCSSFKQALYFKENCGLNLHDTMIYEKAQACFGSTKCYLQSFEYMFVFSKGRIQTINFLRDRENKRYGEEKAAKNSRNKKGEKSERVVVCMKKFGKRKNIWKYGVGGVKTNADHPAVFPQRLAEDHIYSWSNPGDTVLDPFLGSGTTAVAAIKMGRKFIGVEVSEEYCEIAKQRIIEAEKKQDDLFGDI